MFKIGDFSKLSNISIRMLRYYEKMELLLPEQVDEDSGFRYYSARQLERAGQIQRLKALGFSLAVIGKILSSDDMEDLEKHFLIRKQELEEELETVAAQSRMLDSVKTIIGKDTELMSYNVVLKEIPQRFVMGVRQIIGSYNDEGILWNTLYAETQKQPIHFSAPLLGLAVFHDKEYKEKDVDVEVQSAVEEGNYTDTDAVKFYTAPATQVASVTFRGSYDQMPKVTQAIAQWIEDNGYAISGPMFNIYHVSPAQDKNPENWVTEACFQVSK